MTLESPFAKFRSAAFEGERTQPLLPVQDTQLAALRPWQSCLLNGSGETLVGHQ